MDPKRPAPLINSVAIYLSFEVQRGLVRFPASMKMPANYKQRGKPENYQI